MQFKWMIWTCLFLLFFALPARAMDFTEFLLLDLSYPAFQPNGDTSTQVSVGLTLGAGVSLGIRVFDRFDIEPGIIYVSRNFAATSAFAPRRGYSFTTAQFPLIIRYWFTDTFSAGAGPYLAHGVGNVVITQGSNATPHGYPDYGWAIDDVGAVLSARFRTSVSELMSIVLDERLMIGTCNIDTTGKGTLEFRDVQSWVGVSFIF